MYMKKITAYFISIIALFAFFPLIANAQDAALYNAAKNLQEQEETPKIDPLAACSETKTTLEEKFEMYSVKKAEHLATYQTLKVSLNGFIGKAKAMGYNTTSLEKDLIEFDKLVNAYDRAFVVFLRNLQNAVVNVCNTNQQLYTSNLALSKTSLETIRESTISIYNYYYESVLEDIKSLVKIEVVEKVEEPAPATTPATTPDEEEGVSDEQ